MAIVHSDPDVLGGTPVFEGHTRAVPKPHRLPGTRLQCRRILDDFPSVTREQVVASLEAAHEALSVRARSAR